jgi:hypothetical protein
VGVDFAIREWAAWAPGLTTPAAWRTWASGPATVPRGTAVPDLAGVPPLDRRRVERMGRPAFQVAAEVQGEDAGVPLVFASRHGAVLRSHELLLDLARGQALSPTGFVLSVHNAVGAQYSIVRGERGHVSAVSNGVFTAEAGVFEAVALLQRAPRVVLVVHDTSLPPLHAPFLDEPEADFAFAWKLERGDAFSLHPGDGGPGPAGDLPHALQVLRFVLNGERSLACGDDTSTWCWSRRA